MVINQWIKTYNLKKNRMIPSKYSYDCNQKFENSQN